MAPSLQSIAVCIEEQQCSQKALDCGTQAVNQNGDMPGPHGTNAISVAASATAHKLGHRKAQSSLGSIADLSELSWSVLTPWGVARRALSEGFTLLELAVQLWTYLGVGYKWSVQFYRLVLYAILLMPGFIQMIAFYFFSPRVIRSVAYGKKPRQRLDLYLPKHMEKDATYPVVVFITGGAWTIGYKAWGALLAKRLSKSGVLVACLDYRNFPQGNALQMLEDVNTGIAWVVRKCTHYQGDPDAVTLVGQSAGGQLGALALLKQAEQAVSRCDVLGASPSWNPSALRGFVGVSGAYDLEGLRDHLHRRGLYKNLFTQIMSINGVPALHELSPLSTVRGWGTGARAAAYMPQVLLVHGTKDKSVPHDGSQQLHDALTMAGVASTCKMVPGKTHTSFLLEGPMMGGRDMLMDMILEVVQGRGKVSTSYHHQYATLCPAVLCHLAGWICPF